MENITSTVKNILIEKMGISESELTLDANFTKDLGIDSLDYAELVMEFETHFDIRIPDTDAEQLQTLGSAIEYIGSKLSAKV
jgi:acyl carrier protein